MNPDAQNWLKSSAYDFKTAEAMLRTRRFVYVIFMCHLSIEKALKAVVCANFHKVPPKTHDLFHLVRICALDIPQEHQPIVMHINEASVPTRYPEDIAKLVKSYNGKVAQKYLTETKGFLKWLSNQIS